MGGLMVTGSRDTVGVVIIDFALLISVALEIRGWRRSLG